MIPTRSRLLQSAWAQLSFPEDTEKGWSWVPSFRPGAMWGKKLASLGNWRAEGKLRRGEQARQFVFPRERFAELRGLSQSQEYSGGVRRKPG